MEQVNRIELIGHIGHIKKTELAEITITRMAVATNYGYKDKEGMFVIETTWHNVAYFGNIDVEKGDGVKIVGRLRAVRYTDEIGNEKINYEVLAKEITKIPLALTCQIEQKSMWGLKE